MTEYDYSEEAVHRYMQTQARIQDWSSATARAPPCDPNTPKTPAVRSRSLPRTRSKPKDSNSAFASSSPYAYNDEPSPAAVGVHTQPAWADKKQAAMRKMQMQAAHATPTPAPANQVYVSYSQQQQTTPYGSQLNISTQTQTASGEYVQQQAYVQRTLQRAPTPQTLEVPPINYAPLAHNPYPTPDHLVLPGAGSGGAPLHRARAKSSQSSRRREGSAGPPAPGHGQGIYAYAPPVPPMPQQAQRPPGAAAPLQPSNGAYANGLYPTPPAWQSSVSSLQLPAGYLPASNQQQYQQQHQQNPPARKSKSSATLNMRYAQEAQRPPVPPMPVMQQNTQKAQGPGAFYALPRGSKSSATLYAEPRSTGKHSRSRRHREPLPEFGEKMSSPHPAASQMLVHSLIPVATYRAAPEPAPVRAKPQSLFKRMLLGKRGA
ncbi:hypothetical protein B0H11DRAFT_2008897, partial [Mycena galericulata]